MATFVVIVEQLTPYSSIALIADEFFDPFDQPFLCSTSLDSANAGPMTFSLTA
ncbi:MAG: hypothetical protein IPI10_14665 [Bacteroidetes bacterium]|nr:hypothetical protein [Bacteroidota bacterium]